MHLSASSHFVRQGISPCKLTHFRNIVTSPTSLTHPSHIGSKPSNSADCLVCKVGRGTGGECRKTNVGYEIVCDKCRENQLEVINHSESSRNVRGLEYRRRHVDSAMYKHAQTHHRGRRYVESSMKITGSFQDPLSRQIEEAVRIQ